MSGSPIDGKYIKSEAKAGRLGSRLPDTVLILVYCFFLYLPHSGAMAAGFVFSVVA